MEKVKLGKHKHTLTDILKVFIFSLVMLAPLMAVATKCLYVSCNKNAKDSYYGETINQEDLIQATQITNNEDYVFLYRSLPNFTQNITFSCSDSTIYIGNEVKTLNNGFFYFNSGQNKNYLAYRLNDNAYSYIDLTSIIRINFYNFNGNYLRTQLIGTFYTIVYNNYSYLDNVFYYAVNELNEQPIFNWTKNTAMYTAINTMTEGLELGENNILALLLTYWTLMTLIYIIFDIVIVLFTKLTHMNN